MRAKSFCKFRRSEDMVDQETLEHIFEFKEALERKSSYLDSDAESIDGEHSNRGNKLKRGFENVSRNKLSSSTFYQVKPEVVEYNREKKLVFLKKRKFNHTNYDNEELSSEDELDDPYKDIDLEEILAPINHPSEIVTHPAISKTFNSNIIKGLAEQTIEIIEKEQENVINFSKLLDVFLGDDPNFALPTNSNIPDYNHGLSMKKNKNDKDNKKNGSESSNNDENKRVTRKQSGQEMDPFFDLPGYQVDKNFDMSESDADEARQLSQLALQRSQELIRCLTSVRNGLIRTERIKDKIFKWSKEMSGDNEDPDDENNKSKI